MKNMFIVLLICISISCTNSVKNTYGFKQQSLNKNDFKNIEVSTDSIKIVKIPPVNGVQKEILASDLFDSCFTIILETKKENLIGEISEIRIYDDKIYVLDNRVSKAVFVFNMEGKYIRRIGENGKGPGEYPKPDGFEIDKKNEELLISSASIRKILRFDFDGNFLGNITPPLGFIDFKVTDNGNIVLLAGDQENTHLGELENRIVYIIDKEGNIISYGPEYYSDFKDVKMQPSANLMANNYEITYSYKLSDTIYSVNDNKINAQYKIDFGKSGINREVLKSCNTHEFLDVVKKGENSPAYFLGTQFQTNDYLYFKFEYNNMFIDCFYNKNQSKTIAGNVVSDSTILYTPSFIAAYNEYLISVMYAHRVLEGKEFLQNNHPQMYKIFLKTLGFDSEFSIKENDNPILYFYKFKKEYYAN